MSAFCMPMLIINMGGEMVYILEQRLHAQNVPMDKSKRGAHYHTHYLNSTPTPGMLYNDARARLRHAGRLRYLSGGGGASAA